MTGSHTRRTLGHKLVAVREQQPSGRVLMAAAHAIATADGRHATARACATAAEFDAREHVGLAGVVLWEVKKRGRRTRQAVGKR